MDSHYNYSSSRQLHSPPRSQQYQTNDRTQFNRDRSSRPHQSREERNSSHQPRQNRSRSPYSYQRVQSRSRSPYSSHQPYHSRNRSPYSSHKLIQKRSQSPHSSYQFRQNRSRSPQQQRRSRSPSPLERNQCFQDSRWPAPESHQSSTYFESFQNNSPYEPNIESPPRFHHSLQNRSISPPQFELFQNRRRSPHAQFQSSQNSNRSLEFHESYDDPISYESLDSFSHLSPYNLPCDDRSNSPSYNSNRYDPSQQTNQDSHWTDQPAFRKKKVIDKGQLINSLYKNYKKGQMLCNPRTNESEPPLHTNQVLYPQSKPPYSTRRFIRKQAKANLKKALYRAYLKETEGTVPPVNKKPKGFNNTKTGNKKSQLRVCIVDQSTQQLVDWQTRLLQRELLRHLDETLKTCGDNPPVFKGWFYKNNKLEINCSNRTSLDWLTEVMSNITALWQGCNLLMIPLARLEEPFLICSIAFRGEQDKQELVIERLIEQNRWIDMTQWRFLNRCTNAKRMIITFGIPYEHAPLLKGQSQFNYKFSKVTLKFRKGELAKLKL